MIRCDLDKNFKEPDKCMLNFCLYFRRRLTDRQGSGGDLYGNFQNNSHSCYQHSTSRWCIVSLFLRFPYNISQPSFLFICHSIVSTLSEEVQHTTVLSLFPSSPPLSAAARRPFRQIEKGPHSGRPHAQHDRKLQAEPSV